MTLLKGIEETTAASRLMIRHRLHLETKGIQFKGTATSVYIRQLLGSKTRNKLKLLAEYEDWMEIQGFTFKRYTESVKLTQPSLD